MFYQPYSDTSKPCELKFSDPNNEKDRYIITNGRINHLLWAIRHGIPILHTNITQVGTNIPIVAAALKYNKEKFMVEPRSDSPQSTLTRIAKIVGLIAVISSIFGVSYQKGMIIKMQLGNLNGNYDVREVINSAIFGYLELFNKASKIQIVDLMLANWEVHIAFLIVGFFIPFIYRKRHSLDKFSESAKQQFRDFFDRVARSYIWSPVAGAVIGFFANLVLSLISYTVLMLTGLLLLPALIGYLLGIGKIETIMDNPPCNAVTEGILEHRYIRQCTQLKMNGETIIGDILLETNDAYFLHLNKSFLYLKKDGRVCIFSKFQLTEEIKDIESFEFERDQTDDLCNAIEMTKNLA